MRAARLYGYKEDYVVEEVPTPEPGPGEVLVRVAGSGACHSDVHIWSGDMAALPLPPFPWVLGHENAGYVEALGPGASGFEIGEPVAVFGGWGCGACRFCLGGQEQICDVMRWGGIGRPGGYAEYLLVPAVRHLVKLGGYDPVLAAPLTDAGLTPYRSVKMALPRLVPGSTVVAIGVGGLGHFGLQYLKHLSPAKVVAVDTLESKRALATGLGADLVLDPTSVDVAAEVRGFSGGEGAAAVIDFVGADSTLALALASVGRQGLVVVVGLAGGSVPFSFFAAATEASVTTSMWGTRNELEEVLALARTGSITAHVERHDLAEINTVFARLRRGEVDGRAVLLPSRS
ncbi:MAG TPA: NAD(P)-dependent alcohol dehydrogenase [Acidimicrobiales bacterium]|nr:NAD(P)-dependent alcohol dehydrogenase [Acidimicrobiales bacterium]